jgi:hypothetical protein
LTRWLPGRVEHRRVDVGQLGEAMCALHTWSARPTRTCTTSSAPTSTPFRSTARCDTSSRRPPVVASEAAARDGPRGTWLYRCVAQRDVTTRRAIGAWGATTCRVRRVPRHHLARHQGPI